MIITGELARRTLEQRNDGAVSVGSAVALPAHVITHSGNKLLFHHDGEAHGQEGTDFRLSNELHGFFTAVYDTSRNELRFTPDDADPTPPPENGAREACSTLVHQVAEDSETVPFVIGLRSEKGEHDHMLGPIHFLVDDEQCVLRLVAILLLFSSSLPTSDVKKSGLVKLGLFVEGRLPGWDPISAQY
ncbi:hypothetical protein QE369_002041 [Agrobacterium larrymoorei]|uniref:Uncharacterized protein n=1 Tax=Agrobacterium larrymoorei TaxID=160699 RepID=A0AAJ2ERI4_9HYPH|nr:hypothetical protein [Agrobacterium larrymoorei]MDR6101844.1 hypothetical protein [Agrobacterium larrymoorei]